MSFDDEDFQREQRLLEERRLFEEEEERRRLEEEDRRRLQLEEDDARRESLRQQPANSPLEPADIKGADSPVDPDAYVEQKAPVRKKMTEEDYQKERDELAKEARGGYLWVVIIILVLLALLGIGLYIYFTFFAAPAS